MNALQFFTHEKINNHFFHIVESYAPCRDPGFDNGSIFNIYVVIGMEKVAVIDTGLGATDGLRQYIEQNIYTKKDKPVIALLGHCHPDHCGAAALFDEVYFNSGELEGLDWGSNIERRLSDLLLFADYNQEVIDFCREHYVKERITAEYPHKLAEDGDVIDLGGIELTVVKLPGHSPGSVLYWNKAEDWACGSDSVQILNNYHGGFEKLEEYKGYLDRAIALFPETIKIYSGHDRVIHTKGTLYLMRESLEDIICGRNLAHDIPKPPRFAMTKPGSQVLIHRFGHIRSSYSAELWNNYHSENALSAEELIKLLEREHNL